MEIKKSRRADLERRKPLWFFAALVINISVFVGVLECNPSDSEMSVEDFAKSVENMTETKEMIASEMTVQAPPERNIVEEDISVSDEIEVVENTEVSEMLLPSAIQKKDSVISEGTDDFEEKPLERTDVVTDLKLLEEIPKYPGGMSFFVKWLTANIKYPHEAKERKIQGLVYASFIISEDGSTSNIAIRKPLSPDCDQEVTRVLEKMDKWIPGKRNGAPCKTMLCIPIEFKL